MVEHKLTSLTFMQIMFRGLTQNVSKCYWTKK